MRDEHGDVIGTFGISRDITPMKQAQQALQQAYSEITTLNGQLKEENVRIERINTVNRMMSFIFHVIFVSGILDMGVVQHCDNMSRKTFGC